MSIPSKISLFKLLPVFVFGLFISCSGPVKETKTSYVKIVTDKGDIVVKLYDKTPKHRDNFLRLVKEQKYDSLLFHRVIQGFVIQGGDPDSKYASPTDTLGEGDLEYTIPAEIDSSLFHKRGALGAARDGNPERASSAMQFYIVQGKVVNDSLLDVAEGRINGWLAQHYYINDPANRSLRDSLQRTIDSKDWEQYEVYDDSVRKEAKTYTNFTKYTIPMSHREVYKTLGGIPHLDQNYTVFGEVVSGMNVVDSIAAVKTDTLDRPVKDVRIRSMIIVKDLTSFSHKTK
ncbi:MAG: peptidylprolyl isomerase [Cyclobacteriaceae bacterium]|nr:peptidylprolyl isomerase [Cyclobacteriaceae bacterium]